MQVHWLFIPYIIPTVVDSVSEVCQASFVIQGQIPSPASPDLAGSKRYVQSSPSLVLPSLDTTPKL